jgi:hypothetical protein
VAPDSKGESAAATAQVRANRGVFPAIAETCPLFFPVASGGSWPTAVQPTRLAPEPISKVAGPEPGAGRVEGARARATATCACPATNETASSFAGRGIGVATQRLMRRRLYGQSAYIISSYIPIPKSYTLTCLLSNVQYVPTPSSREPHWLWRGGQQFDVQGGSMAEVQRDQPRSARNSTNGRVLEPRPHRVGLQISFAFRSEVSALVGN